MDFMNSFALLLLVVFRGSSASLALDRDTNALKLSAAEPWSFLSSLLFWKCFLRQSNMDSIAFSCVLTSTNKHHKSAVLHARLRNQTWSSHSIPLFRREVTEIH
jgi:hypothetical protein